MFYSYLTMTLRLITPIAFPLFLTVSAFAQASHIIVHTHNPEGVEIASIQGMDQRNDQRSVRIYDGDTFIGYGTHDTASHSQSLTI